MKLIKYVETYSGMLDDMQIIKRFFIENDLESEAVAMLSDISESKILKLRDELYFLRGNIEMFSMNTYAKFYPRELADVLERATLRIFLGEDISKDEAIMGELRKAVPKHKINGLLRAELHEILIKNGIYFKGEKNEKE